MLIILEFVTKFSIKSIMETRIGKTGMDEDDDTLLFWRNSTNCSIFLFSFQTDLSLLDEMDEDAHTALNTYIN